MGLYPPLESADGYRLQHIAEVTFRLEKERDFRTSMYKKYRRGFNIVDGLDTALSTASVGLAASALDCCQQTSRCMSPSAFKLERLCVVC